jgi:hypothetical protein
MNKYTIHIHLTDEQDFALRVIQRQYKHDGRDISLNKVLQNIILTELEKRIASIDKS